MEKLHRVIHALHVFRVHADGARLLRAAAEHHGVIFAGETLRNLGVGRVHAGDEGDALVGHEVDAPLHDGLRQLHVRDAVGQDAAGARVLLDDGHAVAAVVELIRHGEPGGPRADDGDVLARVVLREARLHRAGLKGVLDDGALVVVHGDRLVVQPAGAGLLAEGGADAARELGEVVGL